MPFSNYNCNHCNELRMLVTANTEMVYAHGLCTLHIYTYEFSTEQQSQLQGTLSSLPVLCLQVVLLGIDIISALVSRLQDRFKAQIGTGEGSLCECHHHSATTCTGCLTQSCLSSQKSTWEALGGFPALLKASEACASIGLWGESRGALPLLEFFPGGFECSCFLSLVLPSLLDRLGDSKDSVREQDQTLLLKIMEQAANPQVCSAVLHSMND